MGKELKDTVRQKVLDCVAAGETYVNVAKKVGLTKGQIAGIVYRERHRKELHKTTVQERGAGIYKDYSLRFKPCTPARAKHPLIRQLMEEMNRQQCSWEQMYRKAGVGRGLLSYWCAKGPTKLHLIEACFNVLGMTLHIRAVHKPDMD